MTQIVFGMMGSLDSEASVLVFVGLLILLILLETGFTKLETYAIKEDMGELFGKLKKELMMMGILSFAVFIYQTVATSQGQSSDNAYFEAFEMTHIIILFIALAFILQAVFLLNYAISQGKEYLAGTRIQSRALLERMDELEKRPDTWEYWYFHRSPFWFPCFPHWRKEIETKLVERLFRSLHCLPDEFRFSHYVAKLFQKYIAEIGEVSTKSWFLLALLVVVNYLRIAAVDFHENSYYCPHTSVEVPSVAEGGAAAEGAPAEPAGGEGGGEHEGAPPCYPYILSYAFFCVSMLTLFTLGVYVASSFYMDKIYLRSLRLFKIPTGEGERKAYKKALAIFADLEEEREKEGQVKKSTLSEAPISNRRPSHVPLAAHRPLTSSAIGAAGGVSSTARPESVSVEMSSVYSRPESTLLIHSHPPPSATHHQVALSTSHSDGTVSAGDEEAETKAAVAVAAGEEEGDAKESAIVVLSEEKEAIHHVAEITGQREDIVYSDSEEATRNQTELHKEAEKKAEYDKVGWCGFLYLKTLHFFFPRPKHEHAMMDIFFNGSPSAYFEVVEFMLLLQCFYISICFTELLPLANEAAHDNGGAWGFFLTVPIFFNFFIIRLILNRAVILQGVCEIHGEVLSEVKAEAKEEEECLDKLRAGIIDILKKQTNDPKRWKLLVKEIFDKWDTDGGGLSKEEFGSFLLDMKVYTIKKSFDILWTAIDFDLSGSISWDELFVMVFPELKLEMRSELKIIADLRRHFKAKMVAQGTPVASYRQVLEQLFNKYDNDNSASIDPSEFGNLISELGVPADMTEKRCISQIFAALDFDAGGQLEFNEFADLMLAEGEADSGSGSLSALVSNPMLSSFKSKKKS